MQSADHFIFMKNFEYFCLFFTIYLAIAHKPMYNIHYKQDNIPVFLPHTLYISSEYPEDIYRIYNQSFA